MVGEIVEKPRSMVLRTQLAGWLGLLGAVSVASHALWYASTHNTTGAPELTIGLVSAFLAYSAACFGVAAYRGKKEDCH